jgi:hypothetical protein
VALIENLLQLKCRHFQWVAHMLTQSLRQQRIDGSRAILETLEARQQIRFLDITTGDESWIYLGKS